jgi:hypothetical protein
VFDPMLSPGDALPSIDEARRYLERSLGDVEADELGKQVRFRASA